MYFFTATINSWQSLLHDDKIKTIIINSLEWMVNQKKAHVHAFVIMPNHIHLLWSGDEMDKTENMLIRFTAHEFKKYMELHNPSQLAHYVSTQNDRMYHFWERRSKTIEVKSRKIAEQKLIYIHNNPLQEKWQLVALPGDYHFSSASFYEGLDTPFSFISHYADHI